MHDSHEEGYRYVQPQACIDELRAKLEKFLRALVPSGGLEGEEMSEDEWIAGLDKAAEGARATLERTKP